MNTNEKTIEKFDKHVAHSYGRYPLAMKKGSGRRCVDENGKVYIDFGSGIGTNSLGYCDALRMSRARRTGEGRAGRTAGTSSRWS